MGNTYSTEQKDHGVLNEAVLNDTVLDKEEEPSHVQINVRPDIRPINSFESISEHINCFQQENLFQPIQQEKSTDTIIDVMDNLPIEIPVYARPNVVPSNIVLSNVVPSNVVPSNIGPTLKRAKSHQIHDTKESPYNHEIVMEYDIKKDLPIHNPSEVMDSTIIVDETGSMIDMGDEPIRAVNEYIKGQRESGFDVNITIIRFANHIAMTKKDITDPDLNINDYEPNGMTALIDAVIFGILNGTKPQHVVILTDGKDNISVRTLDEMNELIQRAESCGWTFTFIGCNKDGYEQGTQFRMSSQPINLQSEDGPMSLLYAMREVSNQTVKLNREYST
jgi:hypothetical protein